MRTLTGFQGMSREEVDAHIKPLLEPSASQQSQASASSDNEDPKAHITYRNYSRIIVFPPPSSFVHHHLSAMAGRNFLKEPVEGLKTLHAMGIMHRDLGPENMLDQQRDGRSRKFEGAATFSWFVYTLNSFSISVFKVPSWRIYINGVEQGI